MQKFLVAFPAFFSVEAVCFGEAHAVLFCPVFIFVVHGVGLTLNQILGDFNLCTLNDHFDGSVL